MKSRVVVSAHDAGGAEILSAWVGENKKKYEIYLCLLGPAIEIFERDHGHLNNQTVEVVKKLGIRDFLLTSTGTSSDFERSVLDYAKDQNVRTIAFLDHWDFYKERFGDEENWKNCLPDEIWVGDKFALAKAIDDGFPEDSIKILSNPYDRKLLSLFSDKVAMNTKLSILYVTEPIMDKLRQQFGDECSRYDNENKILATFLNDLEEYHDLVSGITIRLHPRERFDKYDVTLSQSTRNIPVTYSTNESLIDDLEQHTTVVGVESVALINALTVGRGVYSFISGRHWDISLPHPGLKHINKTADLFVGINK